jgi:hypothetical protein
MYEYMVEVRAHEKASEESAYLNRVDEAGWELVAVTNVEGVGGLGWGYFYFRRRRA